MNAKVKGRDPLATILLGYRWAGQPWGATENLQLEPSLPEALPTPALPSPKVGESQRPEGLFR